MMSCRACFSQYIRALDAVAAPAAASRHDAVAAAAAASRAHHNVAIRSYHAGPVRKVLPRDARDARDEHPAPSHHQPRTQKEQWIAGLKKKEKKALSSRQTGKTAQAAPRTRRDPSVSLEDWNKRRRELQYLTDPLELANFVKQELVKDKETEMLQLVRMASRDMQCQVSWNHIVRHMLANGKTAQALKIYNEMKKRAQFPDAYTYSILLNGFAENAENSGVLEQALTVYHSMSAENSRVQPSIVHTNAMLKTCARRLNMDALWGVAAKIPDKGPGAANARTYATILNAIRQSLLINPPLGELDKEKAIRLDRGVVEGRRVWEEIIHKWRNAEVVIDEDLVCAMGRLLLVGARPRDWDDVLSLVEQTMDVPRLIPRLGTPEREKLGYPHLRAPDVPADFKFDDDHLSPSQTPARGDEFLPISPLGVRGLTSSLAYARPSNNTLSLVMEACQKIVGKDAGDKYWDFLTDPGTYHIMPDINNLNMRLRVLRQNRGSGAAVKLLTTYFGDKGVVPPPGTFRIAMSTCVRDKNNHNSLKHASAILDFLTSTRENADPRAVSMYCELALRFPLKTGADLVDALARLEPITKNIRIQLGVGSPRFASMAGRNGWLSRDDREDAVEALRKIYAVHDQLVLSDLISEEEKKPYKAARATLSAYLTRVSMKDAGKEREPGKRWQDMKKEFGESVDEEGGKYARFGQQRERRSVPERSFSRRQSLAEQRNSA